LLVFTLALRTLVGLALLATIDIATLLCPPQLTDMLDRFRATRGLRPASSLAIAFDAGALDDGMLLFDGLTEAPDEGMKVTQAERADTFTLTGRELLLIIGAITHELFQLCATFLHAPLARCERRRGTLFQRVDHALHGLEAFTARHAGTSAINASSDARLVL
jgi:hypothetical protein